MDEFWQFTILAWGATLAILNPVGILPQFIAFTADFSSRARAQIAGRAVVVAGALLLGMAVLGTTIFQVFGITIEAFRIAGGVLLFVISLDMLHARASRARTTPEEHAEGVAKDDIAVFPVAIPLIAGPGSITTAVVLSHEASGFPQSASLVGAIAGTLLLLYVALRLAVPIAGRMGQIGMNVLTRLMGLLLAAISCQFILDGISSAFGIHARGPG